MVANGCSVHDGEVGDKGKDFTDIANNFDVLFCDWVANVDRNFEVKVEGIFVDGGNLVQFPEGLEAVFIFRREGHKRRLHIVDGEAISGGFRGRIGLVDELEDVVGSCAEENCAF